MALALQDQNLVWQKVFKSLDVQVAGDLVAVSLEVVRVCGVLRGRGDPASSEPQPLLERSDVLSGDDLAGHRIAFRVESPLLGEQ